MDGGFPGQLAVFGENIDIIQKKETQLKTGIEQEKNQNNSSTASSLWLSCNHHQMANALNIIKRNVSNATWVRPAVTAKIHLCTIRSIGFKFIEKLILSRHFEFVVVCGHVECKYLHKNKSFKQEKDSAHFRKLNGLQSQQEAIIESKRAILSKVKVISAIPSIANQISEKNLQVTGCLFLQESGIFVPCVPGQSDLEHPDF